MAAGIVLKNLSKVEKIEVEKIELTKEISNYQSQ